MDSSSLFFEDSNDFLQHKIDQARKKAQDEVDQAAARKKEAQKEARNLLASAYEDAADIAFSGIHEGLNANTCQQISAALRLQAALIRGDVNE